MPINFLVLILTTRCDLKCAYCYNGDQPPLDMDRRVLAQSLALAASGEGPLRLQLTGGEPTLVPELIEAVAQEAEKLRRPYRLCLQTNATLLDRPYVKTLKKLKVEVGVSLDGPPELNDELRGRSRAVFMGLSALEREAWPFAATTVVSQANCGELDKLPLILAQYATAKGLGLDLLIQKGRGEAKAPTKEELFAGVAKLRKSLEFINARRPSPLALREAELIKRAKSQKSEGFCEACHGRTLAVAPDGRAYACGQTAFNDDFRLGEVFSLKLRPSPLIGESLTGPHCEGCFLKGSCPGECPSRLYFNRLANPDLACSLYRALA
jgi:uncharacterized protein